MRNGLRSRWLVLPLLVAAAALAALAAMALEARRDLQRRPVDDTAARPLRPVTLGVLGDSDSQSYHSDTDFPHRFGPFRDVTWQWTEVLARLRGDEIDLGPWGLRGTRRSTAALMDLLGRPGRHPPKEDYLHNLAIGGGGCEGLLGYDGRQAPRLRALMDRDPARWRQGVVVVRIGINSFGGGDRLDALAADPQDAAVQGRIDACLAAIDASVKLIHAAHPSVRFVLVGVLSNADDPTQFARWPSAAAWQRIHLGLDRFDDGLRRMAAADPRRIAFFDDRAWFAARWGQRAADGGPQGYRTLRIGPCAEPVRWSAGDDPRHAVTQDAHAGTVWTTLWAQSLVAMLRTRFGLPVAAIGDDEVWRFVAPAFALAHAQEAGASGASRPKCAIGAVQP